MKSWSETWHVKWMHDLPTWLCCLCMPSSMKDYSQNFHMNRIIQVSSTTNCDNWKVKSLMHTVSTTIQVTTWRFKFFSRLYINTWLTFCLLKISLCTKICEHLSWISLGSFCTGVWNIQGSLPRKRRPLRVRSLLVLITLNPKEIIHSRVLQCIWHDYSEEMRNWSLLQWVRTTFFFDRGHNTALDPKARRCITCGHLWGDWCISSDRELWDHMRNKLWKG